MNIMELMNYNYQVMRNGKEAFESKLGQIQTMIASSFIKTPHTKEEVETFESNLYGDSRVFGDLAANYASIDFVYPTWDKLKSQIITKENIESKAK